MGHLLQLARAREKVAKGQTVLKLVLALQQEFLADFMFKLRTLVLK